MLAPERRCLFKHKEGSWYVKPEKAAYAIMVNSWEEGMKLVTGSWEAFLDFYSSNLMQ